VSGLYLYALVGDLPRTADLGAGLAGEPLRLIDAAGLDVACGEIDAPPAPTAAALAAHDTAVRRLAEIAPAVLPFRFGQRAADPAALAAALAPRAAELGAALVRVAGCVQMTLRVFGDDAGGGPAEPAGDEPAVESEEAGPGTRYLAARRLRERSALALPVVAELRAALRPLVRAERLERHGRGRLLLSVHDLVPAEAAAGYRARVEAASARRRGEGPRVTVSGPWPPYAFGAAALDRGER
jgi:hypothetical protein